MEVRKGVLKSVNKQKADNSAEHEQKPKKRVGIDESEAIRVKKQLVSGIQFSAKDLPAKIIKSKTNKNLSQKVKVVDPSKYNLRPRKPKKEECVKVAGDVSDPTMMPINDQLILIKRIQKCTPHNNQKGYQYWLKHLEWQNVAFKDYNIDQCKQIWSELCKKVPPGRLLVSEIISDITERIKSNRKNTSKNNAKKYLAEHHSPSSPYYFHYRMDNLAIRRPDLQGAAFAKYVKETFEKLPMQKKLKYHAMALKVRVDRGIRTLEPSND